ncbi:MAG: UDP-N-acetylmuramoylalanine--D-glutamate ligase [Thermoleophilaceae bacterium]|nr:UDP-N-acetylmuramoylalanine--D-glutamate ligase [Thermoleophilaceae bacterium]
MSGEGRRSERPPLPRGPYLVVGLARSGAAAMRLLAEHGEAIGVDSGEPPGARELPNAHLGADGVELLESVRTVVKSPGVPREAPVIAEALRRGIEVTGELEIAWRLLPNDFVAITGTNGKTTTTELLGAIHRTAGIPVAVAGNVGTPLASLAGRIEPDAVVVAEASSFQLEDSSAFAPDAAVLLNLAPDHLDRHHTLDAYRAAKLRIFANQGPDQVAVIPPGVEVPGAGRRIAFGEEHLAGAEVRLRGPHNRENAMAAAAAALARGIDPDAIRSALASFAGVPHRLEEVAIRDGVTYVNDSKATNVASATVGIRAFEGGVHAILGGSLKGGGFADLRAPVQERCAAVYLIGEAAGEIERDLAGAAPITRSGHLERAVADARAAARPGDTVLLSPACASYDQYANYEERGDHFRALATGRAASPAAGGESA